MKLRIRGEGMIGTPPSNRSCWEIIAMLYMSRLWGKGSFLIVRSPRAHLHEDEDVRWGFKGNEN